LLFGFGIFSPGENQEKFNKKKLGKIMQKNLAGYLVFTN
jgi:hypothetical protein